MRHISRMSVVSVLTVLALLAGSVHAQETTTAATTPPAAVTTTTPPPAAITTTTPAAVTSQTSATPQTTSPAAAATTSTSRSSLPTTTRDSLPSLITAKLPGATQNVPTYQVVIPNVADNPFLQKSQYPDGTVFIIVGSCLAGLALIVIGWRAAYIWCLHRQTKERRKLHKYSEMGERPFTAVNGSTLNGGVSNNPFTRDISLDYLKPGNRWSQTSFVSRPSTAKTANTSTRPLSTADPIIPSSVQFYSPSAHPGGTAAAALGTQAADRSSSYLPAGYYLRDASSPANISSSATPTSPRQMYATPASSSLLLPDQITSQLPRASRSSASVVTINGGRNGSGPSSAYGVAPARPLSTGYPPSPGAYPQPRRTQTSYSDASAGDRRSKPSQVLDDLLGGRS